MRLLKIRKQITIKQKTWDLLEQMAKQAEKMRPGTCYSASSMIDHITEKYGCDRQLIIKEEIRDTQNKLMWLQEQLEILQKKINGEL